MSYFSEELKEEVCILGVRFFKFDPKLPRESKKNLRLCPIETIRPFVLTVSPFYIYLKRNQKFVAIKRMFDFFTPKEITRLKPYQTLYVLPHVRDFETERRMGATLRVVLKKYSSSPPFLISKKVKKLLNIYLKTHSTMQPFQMFVLINELCDPFSSKMLFSCREKNISLLEEGVYYSSWAVFLLLELEYLDLSFLNHFRTLSFLSICEERFPQGLTFQLQAFLKDLLGMFHEQNEKNTLSITDKKDALQTVEHPSFSVFPKFSTDFFNKKIERKKLWMEMETS